MFSKRGLSNLVATVLIVLLSLAAVAIVWGFLQPAFKGAGTQTQLRTQCFSIDLAALTCDTVANGTSGNITTLTVKLNSGGGTYLTGLLGVFEDSTSATHTSRSTQVPTALESRNIVYGHPNTQIIRQARVAAILSDGVNEEVCQESVPVACS